MGFKIRLLVPGENETQQEIIIPVPCLAHIHTRTYISDTDSHLSIIYVTISLSEESTILITNYRWWFCYPIGKFTIILSI